MSDPMGDESVAKEIYAQDFVDLVDDLPNQLSPLISQVLTLDYQLMKAMAKIEIIWTQMTGHQKGKNESVDQNGPQMTQINTYLSQIKDIYEKKHQLSQTLVQKIKDKQTQLAEDYRNLLLSSSLSSATQQAITYGTRSGRPFTQSHDH